MCPLRENGRGVQVRHKLLIDDTPYTLRTGSLWNQEFRVAAQPATPLSRSEGRADVQVISPLSERSASVLRQATSARTERTAARGQVPPLVHWNPQLNGATLAIRNVSALVDIERGLDDALDL